MITSFSQMMRLGYTNHVPLAGHPLKRKMIEPHIESYNVLIVEREPYHSETKPAGVPLDLNALWKDVLGMYRLQNKVNSRENLPIGREGHTVS